MLDPNQEIYIGVFPHVRKAKSPLSRVRQRRFFDKAVGRLFFSLFLGTALSLQGAAPWRGQNGRPQPKDSLALLTDVTLIA